MVYLVTYGGAGSLEPCSQVPSTAQHPWVPQGHRRWLQKGSRGRQAAMPQGQARFGADAGNLIALIITCCTGTQARSGQKAVPPSLHTLLSSLLTAHGSGFALCFSCDGHKVTDPHFLILPENLSLFITRVP